MAVMHSNGGVSTGRSRIVWHDVLAQLEGSRPAIAANGVGLKKPRSAPTRYYLAGKYAGVYLTVRQRDVLRLFLQDKAASEIARDLVLSERTIEDYSRVLRQKFACATKKELVARLRAEGMDKAVLQLH